MVIRKINKIRSLIPTEIAILLVNSLVLSKLDYCNSLLIHISQDKMKRLQHVQNCAARVIMRKNKFDSATPLLIELHWLPVNKRIIYKICTIVFKSILDQGPMYIKEMINIYTPSRNLRSSDDSNILIKPKTSLKIGERSFLFSAPHYWNILPKHVRHSDNLGTFKSRLKFYLFTH